MCKVEHYDGTKILSMKDLSGNTPEIFVVDGNRSTGKTTFFSRMLVNRFIKTGQKFVLLYRYAYEISDCADKFFKEINHLFFEGAEMTHKIRAKGVYGELFLDGVSCGYVTALAKAEQIKRYSHLMSDASSIMMDEFQSENNRYIPNEISAFISIHRSLARGGGKHIKYMPVYMLSNAVSLLNPYYASWGVMNRLRDNTKFLRGEGWVLQFSQMDAIAKLQANSGFDKAFKGERYLAYANERVYLNDNSALVENMKGNNNYLFTLFYGDKGFAVREYPSEGVLYVDTNVDTTAKLNITTLVDSVTGEVSMMRKNELLIASCIDFFRQGRVRFRNLECKDAFMNTLMA